MLLATTVELFDGLVAPRHPRPGPARRDRRLRPLRRHARPHRRAGGRRRPGRAGRRADRGARRRAGGARRRADRGRRRAAGQHRHHRRRARPGLGRRRGRRAGRPIPMCCTCSAPPPSGTTTTASSWRCERRTDHLGAEAPAALSAGSGSGASGPATSSSRPAPTNARSCSPTTTVPASCSPHGARTFLHRYGVQGRRAGRRVHHQRQRLRRRGRPARRRRARSTPSSTPAPRRRRSGARPSATAAASRCGPARWSPARAATSASPHARGRPARRSATSGEPLSPATCCWSAAAGTRRCTCSARPAASCATTTRSGRSCPASSSPGVSVAGAANGVFDLAGCLRERRARPAPRRSANSASPPAAPIAGGRPTEDGESPQPPGAVAGARPAAPQTRQFVDLQRDATVADLARAVGAGMRSVEHIKRYTTIGTAHDQGKTSGVIASGITAELLGRPRSRASAPPRSGRRTRRSRSPRWPDAAAVACSTPNGSPRVHDWHVDPRRGVRGRRAVEAPALLPAARGGHGDRGAARVRRRPRRRRHPRRLHPRQDRRAGPGRRARSSTCSTRT